MAQVHETSDTGLTADYFAYKGGQVWNGSAYENVLEANIATYRIAATELDSSGVYQATLPDDATFYELREQAATFALSTVRANGSTQAMVQPLTELDGAGGRRLTIAGADGDTLETLSDQIDTIDVETDDIAAIKASTDLITNNNVFTRSRITSDGSIEIYKGESLEFDEGTHVDIVKPTGATWPTDLTGYTITYRARKRKSNRAGGEDELDKAMSIVTATGASQTVRLELTKADTDGLAIGVNGWDFQVEADNGTDLSILTSGTQTVIERFE